MRILEPQMACLVSSSCSTSGEVLRSHVPTQAASLSSNLSLSLPQFRVMVMESTPVGKEWLESADTRKTDLKRSGSYAFLHNTYFMLLMGTFRGFHLVHGFPWSQLKVTLPG